MADTWVTDLQDFLDESGRFPKNLPGPARLIAEHIARIVEVATVRPSAREWPSAVARCRRRPRRRACVGRIVVQRERGKIEWRCPVCGDNGVVTGFLHTMWDLTGAKVPDQKSAQLSVTYDELAALVAIDGIDDDDHALIVAARDNGCDAVIDLPPKELADFRDSLSAAAEDDETRPREAGLIREVALRLDLGDDVRRAPVDTSVDDHRFRGDWRIVEMDKWDADYLDMEVPAFIALEANNLGGFQFGLVQGDIDYRVTSVGGRPRADWSFIGRDEMDEASGRGWAHVDGDILTGKLFFHRGDESGFRAERQRPQRRR